jgi:hypothetical protein
MDIGPAFGNSGSLDTSYSTKHSVCLRENSGDAATHFSFHFKHAEPEREVGAPLWISVNLAWMDGFKDGLANSHATEELMI